MTDLFVTSLPPKVVQGISIVENGHLDQAWNFFSDLSHEDPENPLVKSFVGMLRAVRNGEIEEGIDQCKEAQANDPRDALIYLNLAKSLIRGGNRYGAIQALRRGLKYRSPYHRLLRNCLEMVGLRRRPPFRFLHRDHPINKIAGSLTWKFSSARKLQRDRRIQMRYRT